MRVELDVNEVKSLFERSSHQDDVLEGLYRMVIPEWDRIEYIVEEGRISERLDGGRYSLYSRNSMKNIMGTSYFPDICGLVWASSWIKS